MQLVAYGAQDIYLTGNPQITFFKVVYRRHTNFAMEAIEQTFTGSTNFGSTSKALVSRNGDLVSDIHLEITLPHIISTSAGGRWTDSVGHYLIDQVDIEIGGQLIDRHYGDWLEIWAQLSVNASQRSSYFELIGLDGVTGLQTPTSAADEYVGMGANLDEDGRRVLFVPMQFWFCRNIGLSLPLIALQYHEVTVTIKFADFDKLAINAIRAPGETLGAKLWVNYIYLDTDERRRFAQVSHEYLIEQLQFHGDVGYDSNQVNIDLTLNHPVKELLWVCRQDDHTDANQLSNYTNTLADPIDIQQAFARPQMDRSLAMGDIGGDLNAAVATYRRDVSSNMVQSAKLQLNGHDRFSTQNGTYFNRYQTLKYHTSSPASPGINVYSFAVKPEDHQPSGTCNFSRIDNARLAIKLNAFTADADGAATSLKGVVKLYATNYNVLRIMSGMGGLAYSN